jgi:hypothetical protein
MTKTRLALSLLSMAAAASAFAGTEPEIQSSPKPVVEISSDLFSLESTYTFSSDFKDEPRLGHVDSLYTDFSYDHRFLIRDNWYLRAGVEYERYDFNGTDNGLPDHLQALFANLAFEYVVKDRAGAGIELDPGFYYQNRITGGAFDIPWKVFVSFPVKKDKIFGIIGLGGGLNQDPVVAPGGGLIWLISDKLRLQGVFPKPALVYDLADDWEVRITGNLAFDSFRTDDVITPLRKLREHNAWVQYNEDRAGVQIGYSGLKPFRITAAGGYTFIRDFNFFRLPVREKTDPAPFIQLTVDAKF